MASQSRQSNQRRQEVPASSKTKISAVKKLLFSITTMIAALALLEGVCSFIWLAPDYQQFIHQKKQQLEQITFLEVHHSRFDPELGWSHIPGKKIPNFYGPGAQLTINNDGLRGLVDYTGNKVAGKSRIVCLGDSFTMGYGVSDERTFPARLEAINPKIQAVNMGQGAYSVGQCYLWYQRLNKQLDADLVVCSLILEDFRRLGLRIVNNKFETPQFELKDGRVIVTNTPLREKSQNAESLSGVGEFSGYLGRRSSLARSVASMLGLDQTGQSADPAVLVELGLAIVAQLNREIREEGRHFVLVLLPGVEDLVHPGFRSAYQSVAKDIERFAEWNEIPFLDLGPSFMVQRIELIRSFFLIESYHHYSPAGNQFVAEQIDRWLASNFSDYPHP